MKFLFVSTHLPVAGGTATGGVVRAAAQGLLELGHDVEVVTWSASDPHADLPAYARWLPAPVEPWPRRRLRGLVRPRSRSSLLRLDIDPETVAIAEEFPSFAAVEHAPRAVLSVHYSTALDHRAVSGRGRAGAQDRRAERRAIGDAALVTAYSSRVAEAVGATAVVPVPVIAPATSLRLVDEPVAALLADWSWAPNRVAVERLLAAWPLVRERVPAARLVLAGRGALPADAGAGARDGVEVLGQVPDATDLLAQAAVVAFPCPATSGPKMKVFEAMSYGLPVLTTAAGAEGVADADAVAVAGERPDEFAAALADLLADPASRAALAQRARAAIESAHAPAASGAVRVAAATARFGA
ncbi:MAG: glycosyltransferase [Frankiales bacterium]|nr:glycosyltransferase [Frankiales bacterium]